MIPLPRALLACAVLLLLPVAVNVPAAAAAAASPPAAPASVQAQTSPGAVAVTWTVGSAVGVSGFEVRCVGTGTSPALSAHESAAARTVVLTGLPDGVAYRCSVAATGPGGTSAATTSPFVAHVVVGATGTPVSVAVPVTAKQRLSASVDYPADPPFFFPQLTVYRPDGGRVSTSGFGPSAVFADAAPMSTTGTARVVVSLPADAARDFELKAYAFQDRTAALQVDGPETSLVLRNPGQNATVTFSGTAGQLVALSSGATGFPSVPYTLSSDGGGLRYQGSTFGGGGLSSRIALPDTGRYTLRLDPNGVDTGTLSLQVVTIEQDDTGTTAVDAPAETISVSRLQQARRVFTGTAGQRIGVQGSASAELGSVRWRVVAPDGSEVGSGVLEGAASFQEVAATPTETGTYLLSLVPYSANAGSLSVRLVTVPADSAGRIVVDGPAVTISFSPGQGARRTFHGTAGQRLRLHATGSASLGYLQYVVIGPGAVGTGSGDLHAEQGYAELYPLPASGTYTIQLTGYSTAYGDLQLRVATIEPDTTGELVLGQQTRISFSPGQDATRTLPCAAGQRFLFRATTSARLSDVYYTLLQPNDGPFALSSVVAGGGGRKTDVSSSITESGTCTLALDPAGAGAGALTVTITRYNTSP